MPCGCEMSCGGCRSFPPPTNESRLAKDVRMRPSRRLVSPIFLPMVVECRRSFNNERLLTMSTSFEPRPVMINLSESIAAKRDRLLTLLASYGSCAVAFSGGVDSAVVAKAARVALGDRAVAVTGTSASLAEGELEAAQRLADRIGVRHVVLPTDEVADPAYAANARDRCFHCKTELYTKLRGLADRLGVAVLANGAIVEDLGDYRPGIEAARQHDVRSPLVECSLTKAEVRQLARDWELPVADKPAMPCLSSRIAYDQQVTPERLRMVDRAEQVLRSLGLKSLRVRYHEGDMARIEVPAHEVDVLCEPGVRDYLTAEFRRIGFKYVTVDLEGFRSGSLNDVIQVERWGGQS